MKKEDNWMCAHHDIEPVDDNDIKEQARRLFDSDKSPLAFLIKSNGSVTIIGEPKKWWEFWK